MEMALHKWRIKYESGIEIKKIQCTFFLFVNIRFFIPPDVWNIYQKIRCKKCKLKEIFISFVLQSSVLIFLPFHDYFEEFNVVHLLCNSIESCFNEVKK